MTIFYELLASQWRRGFLVSSWKKFTSRASARKGTENAKLSEIKDTNSGTKVKPGGENGASVPSRVFLLTFFFILFFFFFRFARFSLSLPCLMMGRERIQSVPNKSAGFNTCTCDPTPRCHGDLLSSQTAFCKSKLKGIKVSFQFPQSFSDWIEGRRKKETRVEKGNKNRGNKWR